MGLSLYEKRRPGEADDRGLEQVSDANNEDHPRSNENQSQAGLATNMIPSSHHKDDGLPNGRLYAFCPWMSETLPSLGQDENAQQAARHNRRPVTRTTPDPLAVARYRNTTLCSFVRLPDELLLKIMGKISFDDIDTMRALRQTCSEFMRLYQGPEYRLYRDRRTKNQADGCPHQMMMVCPNQSQSMRIIQRNLNTLKLLSTMPEYANNIYSRRATAFLHCISCGADHAESLFSDVDRMAVSSSERRCIAWQGDLVLCPHKSIRLNDIERLVARQQQTDRKRLLPVPPSDISATARAAAFTATSGITNVGRAVLGEFSCRHADHSAMQHYNNVGDVMENAGATELEDNTDKKGELHDKATRMGFVFPTVTIEDWGATDRPDPNESFESRMQCDRERAIVAVWRYTAHVDLVDWIRRHNDHGRLTNSRNGRADSSHDGSLAPITGDMWRSIVQSLRAGPSESETASPVHYMMSTLPDGIPEPELRCVDPHRCGCILYPPVGGEVEATESKDRPCKFNHEAIFRVHLQDNGMPDTVHVRLSTCKEKSHMLPLETKDEIHEKGKGKAVDAPQDMDQNQIQRCIQIDYTRTVHIKRPAPMLTLYERNRMRSQLCDDDGDMLNGGRSTSAFGPLGVDLSWYTAQQYPRHIHDMDTQTQLLVAAGLAAHPTVTCIDGCMRRSFSMN